MRWLSSANPVRLSPALAALLPAGAVVAASHAAGDPAGLPEVEAAFVRTAVPERRQEFAAGRQCARRALRELGIEHFALRVAADRQPIWPPQVVGSITHTRGFCAAGVAPSAVLEALGLDSEIVNDVGEHLWRRICTPAELAHLQGLPDAARARAAALTFSAKEAFYKCQFSLWGERLHFMDVAIEAEWEGEAGRFTVLPLRSLAVTEGRAGPIDGRFLYHGQFVTTAVALPRSGARVNKPCRRGIS